MKTKKILKISVTLHLILLLCLGLFFQDLANLPKDKINLIETFLVVYFVVSIKFFFDFLRDEN